MKSDNNDNILQDIKKIEKLIQNLYAEAVEIKTFSEKKANEINVKRKKAVDDCQKVLFKLDSSDKQINTYFDEEIKNNNSLLKKSNDSLSNVQNEQIQEIQKKYNYIITNDKKNIALLDSILSQMPEKVVGKYRNNKKVSSNIPPQFEKINSLYEKIKTDTAESFFKKIIASDGYYNQAAMKRDLIILTLQAKKYLENEMVRAKVDFQKQIDLIIDDIELKKRQNDSLSSSFEAQSVRLKESALLSNQASRENAISKKNDILKQIVNEEKENKKQIEMKILNTNANRAKTFSLPLITQFEKNVMQSLLNSGYFEKDWDYDINRQRAEKFVLGCLQIPLKIDSKSLLASLTNALPNRFVNNSFNIPLLLENNETIKMNVWYDEKNKNNAYRYIQSFIVQKMRSNPANSLKTFFVDPNDRGQNLGILIDTIEKNEFIGIQIQNSKNDIRDMLDSIIKYIDVLNGELGTYKNFYEANQLNNKKNKEIILVLCDIQNTIDQDIINDLKIIWENADRCGINILIASKKTANNFLKKDDCYEICFFGNDWKIKYKKMGLDYSFSQIDTKQKEEKFINYYRERYADSLKRNNTFDFNETQLHSVAITEEQQKYGKAFDGIELPIMIDTTDEKICNNLFIGTTNSQHALITGGTGSGKSRLLHMIITSIIMNYHPNDVELWLIDCKKNEFDKFLRIRTPHIRLVSLERTKNFAYAFFDYLNDFAEKRTKKMRELAARLNEEVPNLQTYRRLMNDPYCMPRIVIIIDEFHIITQHLAEEVKYKTMLENMLSEYRSLGISFIFSDQSVSGLKGLTEKGKQQLHCRIAMKNSISEIRETLGDAYDSSIYQDVISLGEKDYGYLWWNKKPNVKYQSIFITGSEETAIINDVNKNNGKIIKESKDILIDGNNRNNFDFDLIKDYFQQKNKELGYDSMQMCVGTPTTFEEVFSFEILPKYNHNILVLGQDTNMTTDLIYSLLKSFEIINNARIILLCDPNDDRYKKILKYDLLLNKSNIEVYDEYTDICQIINELHNKVKQKKMLNEKTFVVWLGITDMNDEFNVSPNKKDIIYDEKQMIDSSDNEGFIIDDIDKIKNDSDLLETAKAMGINLEDTLKLMSNSSNNIKQTNIIEKEKQDCCYNATNDMLEIFSLGGKYGLFNIVSLEYVSDLKNVKGIDMSKFIHKIAFCMTRDESFEWGLRGAASELVEGLTALYTNGIKNSVFKPFIIKEEEK